MSYDVFLAPLHEPSVAPSTVFPAFTDSLTGSDGAFANGVAVSTVVPISIPHTHEDQLEGSVLAAVPVAGSRGDNCSVYLFGEKRTGGAGMVSTSNCFFFRGLFRIVVAVSCSSGVLSFVFPFPYIVRRHWRDIQDPFSQRLRRRTCSSPPGPTTQCARGA